MVERVEVVVDGLDLGPLGDVEAEADEHVLDLAPGLRDQMQAADRGAGSAGQRDVDPVVDQPRVELGSRERRAALIDRLLERLAGLVGGLRRLAARSSGGSCATPRSRFGSSALRPR